MVKVGVALGGGSARGLAHIGVIDSLLEMGVEIECVSGTSIGALVGAGFAAGKHREMKEYALSMDIWNLLMFFDPSIPISGLVNGKRVKDFFMAQLGDRLIEDLDVRYSSVCCDHQTGEEVVMDRGPLADAVRASIAVPGLVTPVRIGDRILIDGGVVNPVPVSAVRALGADMVIAIDLNHYVLEREKVERGRFMKLIESRIMGGEKNIPDIFHMMMDSLYIMERTLSRMKLKEDPPDIMIQPRVGDIGFLDFDRSAEAIKMGRKSAVEKKKEIMKLLVH